MFYSSFAINNNLSRCGIEQTTQDAILDIMNSRVLAYIRNNHPTHPYGHRPISLTGFMLIETIQTYTLHVGSRKHSHLVQRLIFTPYALAWIE